MTLLTTLEHIREIIGEENPVVRTKLFQGLEPTAKAFIARSPLVLLATADRDGRPDVSPKGDEPGFVAVEDDHTLLVPERKGNKLIFALQNILVNPAVALIFLVPGTEETLRVHGTAELKRSRLWHPETWPPNLRISFGKLLAPRLGGGDDLAGSIDRMIEEDYKTNL